MSTEVQVKIEDAGNIHLHLSSKGSRITDGVAKTREEAGCQFVQLEAQGLQANLRGLRHQTERLDGDSGIEGNRCKLINLNKIHGRTSGLTVLVISPLGGAEEPGLGFADLAGCKADGRQVGAGVFVDYIHLQEKGRIEL